MLPCIWGVRGSVTFPGSCRIVRTVDELDFSALYERHARDVHRFALFLSGDVQAAQDVTAETFARVWVARGRIRSGSVKAYLLAIARNLCRDIGRDRRDRKDTPLGDVDVADTAVGPERAAQSRDELRLVLVALQTLPEIDRAVLLMAAVDGMSHQLIAEATGLSTAAVKVRIHRARVRLNLARASKEGTS